MTDAEELIEKVYGCGLKELKAPAGYKLTDIFEIPPQDKIQRYLHYDGENACSGEVSQSKYRPYGQRIWLEPV